MASTLIKNTQEMLVNSVVDRLDYDESFGGSAEEQEDINDSLILDQINQFRTTLHAPLSTARQEFPWQETN